MKGKKSVIQQLNKVLTAELTSINQFFLHARMYRNWRLEKLDQVHYHKSIQDMKQADKLIERILFLEGLPNLQKLGALRIGEKPEEMLACDLEFQMEQITQLRTAIAGCEEEQDYVSRALLEQILSEEENHVDWIESQQSLIGQLGLANWLQANLEED